MPWPPRQADGPPTASLRELLLSAFGRSPLGCAPVRAEPVWESRPVTEFLPVLPSPLYLRFAFELLQPVRNQDRVIADLAKRDLHHFTPVSLNRHPPARLPNRVADVIRAN